MTQAGNQAPEQARGAGDDARFLAEYDPSRYQRPSLTVDVVLLTLRGGCLHTLLVRRTEPPAFGRWALPGGFVRIDESLDDAADRVLAAKAGVSGIFTEQLFTFGAPGRDRRTRVVSVAHYALVPEAAVLRLAAGGRLAEVSAPEGEAGTAVLLDDDGLPLDVAFDHPDMISMAVRRLRGRIWYSPVAAGLLPDAFTIAEARAVYEAIAGEPLNKDVFRYRLLRTGLVEAADGARRGAAHRPAALYRFTPAA